MTNPLLLARAQAIADDFCASIRDTCSYLLVAGSVRRKVPFPNDIEIVAQPRSPQLLWARLDAMLMSKRIQKARYGQSQTTRWGDSYRGLIFCGVRIEIFTCDGHNRGYIAWMRTGPGDAGQFVMGYLQARQWPVRFKDGYAWHVSYNRRHPDFQAANGYARLGRLSVPDEFRLFSMLNMSFVPAMQRRAALYRRHLGQPPGVPEGWYVVEEEEAADVEPQPEQGRLL